MERDIFEKACKIDIEKDTANGILLMLGDVRYQDGCQIILGKSAVIYLPQELASKVIDDIRDYYVRLKEKCEMEFKEL